METSIKQSSTRKGIKKLSVVSNFRKVIEGRDISRMNEELYRFLNLHCGFIAHFDINGFKAVYTPPKAFAEVFIRHFDKDHRYFDGIYPCHKEPYGDTGFSKAEIKEAFNRIVELHKEAIGRWADTAERDTRFNLYKMLREEFQGTVSGLKLNCDACGSQYEVKVLKEGNEFNDFGIICCIFCGRQIKLY